MPVIDSGTLFLGESCLPGPTCGHAALAVQRDELTPIAIYMAAQINANAHGPDAARMLEMNGYSATACISDFTALPLWKQIFGLGITPEQCIDNEISFGTAALLAWALKVRQNGDWDHKPKIASMFHPRSPIVQHWHLYGATLYYHDVWSNIHSPRGRMRREHAAASHRPMRGTRWRAAAPARLWHCAHLRLGVCLLLAACNLFDADRVGISVAFVAPPGARKLTDLSLIVGGEKFSRHYLAGGDTETVTLDPGPVADRQLTLLYTLDGRRNAWEGPVVAARKGYAIDLKIDSQGVVRYRWCMRPCRLDATTTWKEAPSRAVPDAM